MCGEHMSLGQYLYAFPLYPPASRIVALGILKDEIFPDFYKVHI